MIWAIALVEVEMELSAQVLKLRLARPEVSHTFMMHKAALCSRFLHVRSIGRVDGAERGTSIFVNGRKAGKLFQKEARDTPRVRAIAVCSHI